MSERMSAADFNAMSEKKSGVKRVQGAEHMTVDGLTFHSKREARRWGELKLLEKAGEIGDLKRQVKIPLWGQSGPIMTDGGKQQRVYIADFTYVDWRLNGVKVVEDAKGHATEVFNLKKAILEAQNISLLIT